MDSLKTLADIAAVVTFLAGAVSLFVVYTKGKTTQYTIKTLQDLSAALGERVEELETSAIRNNLKVVELEKKLEIALNIPLAKIEEHMQKTNEILAEIIQKVATK